MCDECCSTRYCFEHITSLIQESTGFQLGPDIREKWLLPPGKLDRSDSQIVRNYRWFHRPSVLFRISIGTQVTCTYITWLSQLIEICSITMRPSSHVLEASIITPKEILFCKQTGLYILHTKWVLVVRVHLEALCMFIVTSKTNFMIFKQHPWLFTGWWRQYSVCHSTSWCLCKYFTIWRMTQNIVKNIIGNVASSYQVNLAIEIPNITENCFNSHVFTCWHWVSAMLI